MTPTAYRTLRERIGTQSAVSAALGVHRVTIAKREAGDMPITAEAALALEALSARGVDPKTNRRERAHRAQSARMRPLISRP